MHLVEILLPLNDNSGRPSKKLSRAAARLRAVETARAILALGG
jgi:hypothetical protein